MKIKNKKLLLTGGAGFIGSTLTEKLVDENEIVIYDNFSRDSLQYRKIKSANLKVISGDVLDFETLKKCCEEFRPQMVIHLAAIAGIDTVIINPVKTLEVNILGTLNLLKALRKHADRMERFIDFSTSEVLGTYAYKSSEKSQTNFAPVGEARWTYSVSKVTGEHLTHSFYKMYNYPAVTIRPFNIYGPGQVGEGAIQIFIKRVVQKKNIEIHGDGDQIRSWCYVDDMIEGIEKCMTNPNAVGEVFNIGNPKGTITISSLAEKIISLCKSDSKIIYVPKNYVDVELRIPSIEKAKEILGFFPKVDLNEGILRTFKWYKKNLK